MPFQKTGSLFLAGHDFAMLADDPGLGKSPQAMDAIRLLGLSNGLILCPKIAIPGLIWHFLECGPKDRTIGMASQGVLPNTDFIITNYEQISRKNSPTYKALMKRRWKVLISDEAHYLKNRKARRTRAVYGANCDCLSGLASTTDRVWCLTGTPAPNHAGELYTHFRALHPTYDSPYPKWERAFCRTKETLYGTQILGSKNMKYLRTKVPDFMLRRREKDVLDLPPLRCHALPVSLGDNPNGLLENDIDLMELFGENGFVSGEITIEALKACAMHSATLRRATALLKLPACLEFITGELDGNNRKIVVGAIHHDVIDATMKHLKAFRPVKIDGRDQDIDKRAADIEAFQTDPTIRVFVGQLDAAGVSINLTGAEHVILIESSWVPSTNFQFIKRCHRIGTKRSVLARFLSLPGSVDEDIQIVLARKTAELEQIF